MRKLRGIFGLLQRYYISFSHAGSDYLAQDMPLLGRLDGIPMMIAAKIAPISVIIYFGNFLIALNIQIISCKKALRIPNNSLFWAVAWFLS